MKMTSDAKASSLTKPASSTTKMKTPYASRYGMEMTKDKFPYAYSIN